MSTTTTPQIPDDPNPELRAELEAALAVLAPQIRGLHDLASVGTSSADLHAAILAQITARERRRTMIQQVIDQLNNVVAARGALTADGYPTLDPVPVNGNVLNELESEISDLEAAEKVFTAELAANMTIALGDPAEKQGGH